MIGGQAAAVLLLLMQVIQLCHGLVRFHSPPSFIGRSMGKRQAKVVNAVEAKQPALSNTGAETVLKCDSLSKSFTGIPQFESVSFNLARGQRTGLIGVNGAGKSTFLKCLAGIESADSGKIETATNSNVIYVDQEPDWGDILVYEALFSGSSAAALATRKYYSLMQDESNFDSDAFAKVTDAMESSTGWDYQERGLSIADKLSITEAHLYRPVSSLSGGQRKRVGLAAALLKQPDVLLLDEPTNHLDIDALDWLADYLRLGGRGSRDLTVLLVTHDRYFLERVCNEIVELDRGSLHRYPGNYARYVELKEARLVAEDAEAQRARTKLRTESEWMARQPQARQAKSKAREQQFYALVSKAKGRGPDAKQVELATPEEKERQRRLGGVVAEFSAAHYSMAAAQGGKELLRDFTYSFRQRDRIGIVGPNGVGKSTFLKILAGQLQLSAGAMRLGETVRLGYYEQTGLNITAQQESSTILRFVQEAVEKGGGDSGEDGAKEGSPQIVVETGGALGRRKTQAGKEAGVSVQVAAVGGGGASVAYSEREAMVLLKRFQFPARRWQDRVGRLSGGERRRLQLLQVLARAPNVLLLDEPSNDLDLSTLTALEEYLTEVFQGCLVVVSHDNFFVNRVAEHLFVFQGDGVVNDFQGSYDDYLEYRRESKQTSGKVKTTGVTDEPLSPEAVATPAASKPAADVTQLTKDKRKELGRLEKELESFAAERARLEEELCAASVAMPMDGALMGSLGASIGALMMQVAEKEERWMQLNVL